MFTWDINQVQFCEINFLKMGYSRLLFHYFCLSILQFIDKISPMSGFELWISGFISDRTTNSATTTAQCEIIRFHLSKDAFLQQTQKIAWKRTPRISSWSKSQFWSQTHSSEIFIHREELFYSSRPILREFNQYAHIDREHIDQKNAYSRLISKM